MPLHCPAFDLWRVASPETVKWDGLAAPRSGVACLPLILFTHYVAVFVARVVCAKGARATAKKVLQMFLE
jgi:hypothetical protein